jgi:hypothetical protein
MYLAIAPVFLNDDLRYVVCLEYDWSSFAHILNRNFASIALWGGISLLMVNALLVLFIYRKAVRPLVQVDGGIHAYMKTKDSDAAVQSMSRIRERNEVGRLADSQPSRFLSYAVVLMKTSGYAAKRFSNSTGVR